MRHHGSAPRDRGQGLVEFSIVLPLFLVMLFGVVDFGRVIWANDSLANAAREAARFAIVHGGTASNTCPVGPAAVTAIVPVAGSSCPYPSPSKQAIVDVARRFAMAGGTGLAVTVCYGAGCSGNTDTATNARGTPVTVVVTSHVNLVTGALLGLGNYGVRGSSTMLVNH
jgi:Flp pilus assembly protein TadG